METLLEKCTENITNLTLQVYMSVVLKIFYIFYFYYVQYIQSQ